jgi:hypothetical protein
MDASDFDCSPTILWGAGAIAREINRSRQQTYCLLEAGALPGAKKIAGRWAFRPDVFHRSMSETAA